MIIMAIPVTQTMSVIAITLNALLWNFHLHIQIKIESAIDYKSQQSTSNF